MRNTSTHITLAFPRAETSTLTHRQLKLRWFTIIVCALMMIVVSVKAQTHTMAGGNFALIGSITYYDPGGVGGGSCPSAVSGNYANNLDITETINANAGQRIVVTWSGGLFGLSTGDFLYVYDGPSTASPVLATYTNTTNPIPAVIGSTSTNSITFRFVSDATNTCKGWQATVAAYYFMQPGGFSFSCPGTYTFLDPQQPNSGGPGGDATCVAAGNTKNYQDNISMIESFSTSNGQCISITPFPGAFGICSLDTLKVFDGPSILSPIANGGTAVYTNTWADPPTFSTLGSTATFQFFADNSNHTKGWQINLACVNCPAASINNDCANAIVLSPGASCNPLASSVSVSNSNANPFLAPTCTGANTANDDVWYRFTCSNAISQITVAATDGSMDPVVQLFSGTCGAFTSLYCVNATGAGGTETINATGLTVGTVYYVRVYDVGTTNVNHTFNVCVAGQSSTDCEGAIQVCNTNMLTHTALGYPDFGSQEYNSQYWGCDVSGEIRSAWYYFQIATSGTFGFTVSALSGSSYMDNDFVLWGPMSGLNCPMNTTPLRCSRAIAYSSNSYGLPPYSTGLETGAGDFTEGGSGDAFVETVNAVAGEWYVLMVNIYTGPSSYN
ncbi:MAG TPA: CUB domain-containing protein, partial [Chitinophagales bacterium]|nr:CUB domain-containing protein [Chitinophagales bacterium]